MESTFDLRKAVETAGREIPLQNLSTLGVNRVRVLKMSDIHQMVEAVVARSIESRVLAEAAAESQRLAAQIALKEAQLQEASVLKEEKTRELESELKSLNAQKEEALAALEERRLEWEIEKEQLASEAHEQVKSALRGVVEQSKEQESRLRLTEAARLELAQQLADLVEAGQESQALHEAEIATLQGEIQASRGASLQELESSVAMLAGEKSALANHLEEARQSSARASLEAQRAGEELETALSNFARQKAELRQEHESSLAAERNNFEGERSQLEALLAETRQELEDEAGAHRLLADERLARTEALAAELASANRRSDALAGQIRSLERQTHDQQVELGREEEAKRTLEENLAERDSSISELKTQVASLQLSLGTLRALHESERATNVELLGGKAELEQELAMAHEARVGTCAQLEASEARVTELSAELDGTRTEILELNSERRVVKAERDDLALKITQHEDVLRERQREISRQAQELSRQRGALEDAVRKADENGQALGEFQSKLGELSIKLTQERGEGVLLRSRYADIERHAKGAEEGRLKALELLKDERSRREALELRIPELELQTARRQELDTELAIVRAQLVEQGGESLRHLKELGLWKSRSAELADSLRQVELAQRSWEARCREYQKAYLSRKQGHLKVQEEAAGLRDRVKVLTDDLKEFEAAQSEHLRELVDYDKLKKSSRETEATLKAENDSLLKTFNRLTQELESSRTSLVAREEGLKAERERVAAFRRQMGALLLTETERLLGPDTTAESAQPS